MTRRAYFAGRQPVDARELDDEQRKRSELRGERLGRSDADLGTGARHQHEIRLAHEARFGHVADRERAEIAALLAVAQRRERVGGFARLRHGEEQGAFPHDRAAIAVFAGDLDAARNAGDAFEPVTRDEPGVIARAAGDDLHIAHARQQLVGIDAEDVRQDVVVGDAPFERVGDRARLLEDFLEHVVAVFAALDRVRGHLALAHGTFTGVPSEVVDREAVLRDLGDVAFFEVREVAGFLDQRLHVGAEEMLALADAGDERTAAARADDVSGRIATHHRDRVGAVQALGRVDDGVQQIGAVVHRAQDHVRDDLGVGVRLEAIALAFQLLAQLGVVLDDAVMHHRDAVVGDVRMRVLRVRNAVRRPARVRDAGEAGDRGALVEGFQLANLAGRAHALEPVALQNGDAGRVVAPVFERLEAGDQKGDHISLTRGGYNSAHCWLASGSGSSGRGCGTSVPMIVARGCRWHGRVPDQGG